MSWWTPTVRAVHEPSAGLPSSVRWSSVTSFFAGRNVVTPSPLLTSTPANASPPMATWVG
ncbi:MAG TPA: hypothetical protein VK324_06215 [Tepidisphaeraceae bacterium]|nr:hypothetical protein [Tepidisphaeraceae bacterium]